MHILYANYSLLRFVLGYICNVIWILTAVVGSALTCCIRIMLIDVKLVTWHTHDNKHSTYDVLLHTMCTCHTHYAASEYEQCSQAWQAAWTCYVLNVSMCMLFRTMLSCYISYAASHSGGMHDMMNKHVTSHYGVKVYDANKQNQQHVYMLYIKMKIIALLIWIYNCLIWIYNKHYFHKCDFGLFCQSRSHIFVVIIWT